MLACPDVATPLSLHEPSPFELLAMLDHELRDTLAPIVAALQRMRRSDPTVSLEQGTIERHTERLLRMVEDLHDVSRMAQDRLVLESHVVHVDDVVRDALALAGPALERRRHVLHVDIPGPMRLFGDRRRLARAISHLLWNAATYTPTGRDVWVRAGRVGREITISVRDRGIGIAPEVLEHVLQPFAHAARTPDRAPGGLGLGLGLVCGIVRLHGGRLEVKSGGDGPGTEFRMHLPAPEGEDQREQKDTQRGRAPARPVARVLIVDDNEDAAELLSLALEQMGHAVKVALDGPSALDAAHVFQPQVALLDIGLPIMDGYELAKRLRADTETQRIALVALTGYGQASDRERTRAAGFDAHLVKPVKLSEVDSTIAALLATPAR